MKSSFLMKMMVLLCQGAKKNKLCDYFFDVSKENFK